MWLWLFQSAIFIQVTDMPSSQLLAMIRYGNWISDFDTYRCRIPNHWFSLNQNLPKITYLYSCLWIRFIGISWASLLIQIALCVSRTTAHLEDLFFHSRQLEWSDCTKPLEGVTKNMNISVSQFFLVILQITGIFWNQF